MHKQLGSENFVTEVLLSTKATTVQPKTDVNRTAVSPREYSFSSYIKMHFL